MNISRYRCVGFASLAFSLPELLIAIMVVAVLIAILLPVLSSTRAASRNVQCVSNLRATGQAVIAFAVEGRGQIMLAWVSQNAADVEKYPVLQGNPQAGMMWYQYLLIRRYISDPKILVCPAFPPYTYRQQTAGSEVMMTYGLRRGLAEGAYSYPATMSEEGARSKVLLADTSKPLSWVGQSYYFTVPGNRADTIHLRHRSKGNFFFLDGSVQALDEAGLLATDKGLNDRVIDRAVYQGL